MGMAASQARFLGLTARKTNTEYEGQQINQQRTTLSNQSANYYNDLLGMSVPVPPSIADFTKTVYTFKDGALNNSISTMIAQANGTYLISYTSTWVDDFAAVSSAPSIVTKTDDGYYVGAKQLRTIGSTSAFEGLTFEMGDAVLYNGYLYEKMTTGNSTFYYSAEAAADGKDYDNLFYNNGEWYIEDTYQAVLKDSDTVKCSYKVTGGEYKGEDAYLKTLSNDQIEQLLYEEKQYEKLLDDQYGDSDWSVRYVYNTSAKSWTPYFTKNEVLKSPQTVYDTNGNSLSSIPQYTIGSATKTEEIKGIEARFEQDATGRLINVTLRPGQADETTYAVTTNTSTDQAAYDDAMNQYEYDKYQYDQSIQEINSKIEIIQAEDKNLELRLKQLDTEQDAIQNEMDAVQKVIEKNTESTFKTFG